MNILDRFIYRISTAYLVIPFIIFCAGWLRLIYAIPVIFLLASFVFLIPLVWTQAGQTPIPSNKLGFSFFISALIAFIWVLLSGVGGYFFQNWDHHWRNAVLRDLITFDFPVIYSFPERGPVKALVYYVGYWLPSAMIGKLFGWKAANFALLVWTTLGVWLTLSLLNKKFGASAVKVALFFLFFSGMDALGVLTSATEYPAFLPPIQHLEVWGVDLQYSSFTTQLFWVFNQAVPAWLCLALLSSGLKKEYAVFVWALCFFFAPIASVGMALYVGIEFLRSSLNSGFGDRRSIVISLFTSALIFLISYLYFSSNTAAQKRGFQLIPLADYLFFFILEGGLLWIFLALYHWRDIRWIATGPLLFFIPFIQIGSGNDFTMRASIAPLFYLMILCGETLFQTQTSRLYKTAIVVMLLIGALTPLYEINRSVYRTYEYYFILEKSQRAAPVAEPATRLEEAGALEYEHPNAIAADGILSLRFMKDELSKNFVANVRNSFFFNLLSRWQ